MGVLTHQVGQRMDKGTCYFTLSACNHHIHIEQLILTWVVPASTWKSATSGKRCPTALGFRVVELRDEYIRQTLDWQCNNGV